MKDQQFDDFVKAKLERFDSGAPMQVWERIREKDKKERKFFFLFRRYGLIALALVSLTGIALLTWNGGSTNQTNLQSTNTSTKNSDPTIPQKKNTESQNENQPEISTIQTESSTDPNEIKQPAVNLENKVVNKKNELAELNNQAKDHSAAVLFQQQYKRSKYKNFKGNIAKIFVNNQPTLENKKEKVGANTTINLNTNASTTVLQLTNKANSKFSGNQLQVTAIPFPLIRPGCPTINGPRRNDLYLEIYGSPDYSIRSFSNPSNLNNYVNQRRTSEETRTSFSAGIRLAKNINEKMVLKVGLNYSQINERLRVVNANEKQLTQIITIRTVIRAPGDTLFIRDTSYFEQNGTRYNTTYNRYRFIDLPIIFSYEFGNPEILAFSVNAGPVFNLSSFYHGQVLDTSFNPVKISTARGTGANHWRNNIGVGFYASFAMYKRMNAQLQIFAEPYIRYNFRPVTQNSQLVHQRYSITGMQLGIRYNLFKDKQRY